MRLGIDTTSYRNYRLSQADPLDPEPALGMGVTILGRASRRPGTVVELRTDAEKLIVIVQEDQVVSGVDAFARHDGQVFDRDPAGRKHRFLRTKAGTWQKCVRYDSRDKRWSPCGAASMKLDLREYFDSAVGDGDRR
jgi:hypothetical protein